jgi:hypothetical protein
VYKATEGIVRGREGMFRGEVGKRRVWLEGGGWPLFEYMW